MWRNYKLIQNSKRGPKGSRFLPQIVLGFFNRRFFSRILGFYFPAEPFELPWEFLAVGTRCECCSVPRASSAAFSWARPGLTLIPAQEKPLLGLSHPGCV